MVSHLDPRSYERETKVRKILHLQNIVNQLPDAFNDANKVTRSVIKFCVDILRQQGFHFKRNSIMSIGYVPIPPYFTFKLLTL